VLGQFLNGVEHIVRLEHGRHAVLLFVGNRLKLDVSKFSHQIAHELLLEPLHEIKLIKEADLAFGVTCDGTNTMCKELNGMAEVGSVSILRSRSSFIFNFSSPISFKEVDKILARISVSFEAMEVGSGMD